MDNMNTFNPQQNMAPSKPSSDARKGKTLSTVSLILGIFNIVSSACSFFLSWAFILTRRNTEFSYVVAASSILVITSVLAVVFGAVGLKHGGGLGKVLPGILLSCAAMMIVAFLAVLLGMYWIGKTY